MKLLVSLGLLLLGAASASAANENAIAPQVVGAWQLDVSTPDGVDRSPIIVVGRQHDELLAWYIDEGDPEAFESVRVSGDSLELTIVPREQGGNATVKLIAQANGPDRCYGDLEYRLTNGETGTCEFTGKRIDAELNRVARWSLSFTTPEGEHHDSTLDVFEHGDTLYGWYTGDDYKLLAKSLTVEDDQAKLAISAKLADGSIADVTFQGVIDGTSVSGDALYDVEGDRGSFQFTGREVVN